VPQLFTLGGWLAGGRDWHFGAMGLYAANLGLWIGLLLWRRHRRLTSPGSASTGPRLADVLALACPSPLGAYLAIRSADQSFETWDLASALHPQTLLATPMNGAPAPSSSATSRASGSPAWS
jgi:hypothetical protein